ncbi:hypothetical protein AAF712_006797 [Marasmius tenuissimus]|uniref:Uncharacterized protein n=1 Tax=Marasmius tenuissimus TaxID=585030 RepID=A0ABR2ZYP0_9AGAR|nr:hypothetical protein PM082_017631 [Marasmius tenuissimus]
MALSLHNPPGFVDDLTDEHKKEWSSIIDGFMATPNVNPTSTPLFYNAVLETEQGAQVPAPVTWIGFPKQVKLRFPNDEERWDFADKNRSAQDEYLEWSVKRNSAGKITRIVFCNEGPEYFDFLAQKQPDTLVNLYQKMNPGFDIQSNDLFDSSGNYNPKNKWNNSTNTGAIMHLIQVNNTLGAEVDLGARATVVRKRGDGTLITDSDELINCSGYGNPNRNSDPHIGITVNNAVRDGGLKLTINDPVGLYIQSVNWGVVDPPAGHEDDDPQTFWKWTRGSKDRYMRGEFEVPPGKGYVVGDLLVSGKPLKYGAQMADLITIALHARVAKSTKPVVPRFCGDNPQPSHSANAADLTAPHAYSQLLKKVPSMAKHALKRGD